MVGKLLVLLILIYCIIGDFIAAVLGFGYARLTCLLGILFLLPVYYLQKQNKKIVFIAFLVVCLMFIYYAVCGNIDRVSFFYTILLGYILYLEKEWCLKYLDYIFIFQFLLILIEVLLSRHLYMEVYTGIINQQILDNSAALDFFDETGFRPKGLFSGTLTGCSFVIFYSILNKESKKRVFWAVVMALLMNGRLAILLTSAVAVFYFFNYFKEDQTGTFNLRKLIFITLSSLALLLVTYIISQGIRDRVDRILSAFVFDDASNNLGRVMIYVAAYNTYVEEYDLKSKFFGGEYQVLDAHDRPVAAESDVIGMLLEIGVVGSFIYWVALFKMIRCKSNDFVPVWFVVLLTIMAWIEYRHLTGNMRGSMFWLLYFICTNKNKDYKEQLLIENNDSL